MSNVKCNLKANISAFWITLIIVLIAEGLYSLLLIKLIRNKSTSKTIAPVVMLMIGDGSYLLWYLFIQKHYQESCETGTIKADFDIFLFASFAAMMVLFVSLVYWLFARRYFDMSLKFEKLINPQISNERFITAKRMHKIMIAWIFFWPIISSILVITSNYKGVENDINSPLYKAQLVTSLLQIVPFPISGAVTLVAFQRITKATEGSQFETKPLTMKLFITAQFLNTFSCILLVCSFYSKTIAGVTATYIIMALVSLTNQIIMYWILNSICEGAMLLNQQITTRIEEKVEKKGILELQDSSDDEDEQDDTRYDAIQYMGLGVVVQRSTSITLDDKESRLINQSVNSRFSADRTNSISDERL